MSTPGEFPVKRRRLLRGVAGAGALAALAGCSILGNPPPPRRSDVINSIKVKAGQFRIDLSEQPWVESRKEAGATVVQGTVDGGPLAGVFPIGRAAAKGKGGGGGKGATGRGSGGYSSAPRTGKGRAKYHGGAYTDDWRDDHRESLDRYRVSIVAVGVAYLGSQFEFQDDKPGAGPVPWDKLVDTPSDPITYPVEQSGWYRVGAHLEENGGGTDFGWEAVDLQVDRTAGGMEKDETWKVSPRV